MYNYCFVVIFIIYMLKVSSRAFLLGVQVKLVIIYFFTGPFSLGGWVAVVFVGIVVERSLDTFDSIECVSTIGILVLVIGVVVCISLSVMGSKISQNHPKTTFYIQVTHRCFLNAR